MPRAIIAQSIIATKCLLIMENGGSVGFPNMGKPTHSLFGVVAEQILRVLRIQEYVAQTHNDHTHSPALFRRVDFQGSV